MMMSRLATVDCRATRSNFLLWSENALGGIVKENKGDRGIGRENAHCPVLTISREIDIENGSHSHYQQAQPKRVFQPKRLQPKVNAVLSITYENRDDKKALHNVHYATVP